MSYQTVTDIIIGSQNDVNYQVKDLMKESSSSASKTSFNDLVSFYKNDTKVNEKKATEQPKEVEKTPENEKPVESSSENKEKVEQKEEKDCSSKQVDENDKTEKSEKSEKSDKTEDAKKEKESKKELPNLKNVEVEFESNTKDVKDTKTTDEKDKKSSKLSAKDFSRLNEISEKTNEKDLDKLAKEAIDSKKLPKDFGEEKKEKVENGEPLADAVNTIQITNTEEQTQSNLSNNKKDKDNDFSDKDIKKTNKTYLDKDGKIEVQDLRTNEGKFNDAMNQEKAKLKVSEPKMVNENTATITMELNQNANANVLSTNSQTAASNGSNFQAMLNNQIQQSAPEFVKAGNLILKDNNQGTINLILRPDDLGNVKLHLSLDGKNITGHITVATKEALEVFKDNAKTLREAFIKNGFDQANFDVSFSGNGSSNQHMAFEQQNDGTELLAKRVYNGNAMDREVANLDSISEKSSLNDNYSINIVA